MSEEQRIDNQHTPVVCSECDLHCERRGSSPVVAGDKEDGVFTCGLMHETDRSCLMAIPSVLMIDANSGNARAVRVEFVRVWKRRGWGQPKI